MIRIPFATLSFTVWQYFHGRRALRRLRQELEQEHAIELFRAHAREVSACMEASFKGACRAVEEIMKLPGARELGPVTVRQVGNRLTVEEVQRDAPSRRPN